MKTIRFHRIDNINFERYHGPWFKKFATYCKQYFNVEWVNYATVPDQGTAEIKLLSEVGQFGNTPPLSDVDCIIENLETKEFIVLSFTEYFNSYVVHYLKSSFCKKVCLSHFSYHNIYHWLKRDHLLSQLNKVSPWFFGSFLEFDIEYYRNVRQTTDMFNPELFYKGSGQAYREVINILHDRKILNRDSVEFHNYLTSMATSKCALSYYTDLDRYYTPFHHPGEFCYRDMEYMAIGTPFIRIEYRDSVYQGLLPNYHYAAIPREHAYIAYNMHGNKGVADLIQEKYEEIFHDVDFLNFISNNSRKWFDTYAKWPASAEFTFTLTDMQKWI